MSDAPTAGKRGAFITLEGGEGGGKSTQAKALAARLERAGVRAIVTREPGGSDTAERIREALLAGRFEALGPKAEALLFAAARIDHLDQTIRPALAQGTWVVCDRFHDSTRAYQGALGNIDPRFLRSLERVTLAGTLPDLTLILDLPAEIGMRRAVLRRHLGVPADRFEKQSSDFHEALRQAFLAIAAAEPNRCVIVDAALSRGDVEQAIWTAVLHRLNLPVALPTAYGISTEEIR